MNWKRVMEKGVKLKRLLHKQGGRCYYCNMSISRHYHQGAPLEATIDHRIPRARGGTNAAINLVAACFSCNNRKGNMTSDEFIAHMNGPAMSTARLELWMRADALRLKAK